MSLSIGLAVEQQVKRYLVEQGLKMVVANYRCRCGEIDLIMRDESFFVFVEVRARASDMYGNPLESITVAKQKKLARTAKYYLAKHQLYEKYPCRFDVVSVQNNPVRIKWVKDAFSIQQ